MFSNKLALALLGLAPVALAKVQFLGVAIAGGDFGCQIDGTCPTGSVQFASDAADQMTHFVGNGMNMIRIPTSWQYLVNNQLGATLNSANLAKYDSLMQSCLETGAYCMIDIHNFARWNGGIIGQGGPTDDQFVSLWTQLATKYASSNKVVFELMNEPHDLDINLWAATCQKVVTAIRNAGATSQMILLPGTNFDSAATLISSGSADLLMAIKNPDGTTDNLILDIHKYLDEDNSGTHEECTTNNIDSFTTVAAYLRTNGRKGLISESGASDSASCITDFCAQNTFINQNSDVLVGFVGWAAGSFSTSYVMSLTPTKQNGKYVDNTVMTQCIMAPWLNSNDTVVASSTTVASSTAKASTAPATATAIATTPAASAVESRTTVLMTKTMTGTTLSSLIVAPGTPTPASGSRSSNFTATRSATASATSPIVTNGAISGVDFSTLVVGGALMALFL